MKEIRNSSQLPWVIAHRGASADLPENSGPAMELAQSMQVDAIETDVRLSADGVPVLCHDLNLQRLTGINACVHQRTAEFLARTPLLSQNNADAGCILTLQDLLQRFDRQPFYLEMKDEANLGDDLRRKLAEETVRMAQAAAGPPPMLLSFSDSLLQFANEVPGSKLLRGRNMTHADLHPYDFLSCAVEALTAQFVAAAHAEGQPVICFTVNEADRLQLALHCQVDGIISDRPDWLRRELQATAS